MRYISLLLPALSALALAGCAPAPGVANAAAAPAVSEAQVRREIEAAYAANRAAFLAGDLNALMALRSKGFHTVTPEGQRNDRAAMEAHHRLLLERVRKWNELSFEILKLEIRSPTEVRATTRQHADRVQLRSDGQVRRVETWVTQDETWIKEDGAWKLHFVGNERDMSRKIDGQPA